MKLGIFTDNHSSGLEETIAKRFCENKVDLIVSLGDLIESRDSDSTKDRLEIFAKTKIPFLAIPGNYEWPWKWNEAIKKLTEMYDNLVDGSKPGVYTFKGQDFIHIPGSERNHCGYEVNKETMKSLSSKLDNIDTTKSILLCHEPHYQYGENGTDIAVQAKHRVYNTVKFGRETKAALKDKDYVKVFNHIGNKDIREFVDRNNLVFVFSGHIHEGFSAVNKNGELIDEEKYSPSLYLNPGPAKNGIFAIVDIDNKGNEEKMQIKYKRELLLGKTFYGDLKKN
ncbi:hypothetical protein GOV14_00495 [Candidatus Pacearchaeota archaeon]|nr:hypothetical protein [Candidatus Pacearchaeota archaeon]